MADVRRVEEALAAAQEKLVEVRIHADVMQRMATRAWRDVDTAEREVSDMETALSKAREEYSTSG